MDREPPSRKSSKLRGRTEQLEYPPQKWLEMTPEQYRILHNSGHIISFEKGKPVVNEGDDPEWAGMLLRGTLEVFKEHKGVRVHLGYLYPGDTFGEAALLREEKRRNSIVSFKPSVILKWSKSDLIPLICKNPSVGIWLIHQLFQQLQRMNMKYLGHTTRSSSDVVIDQYKALMAAGIRDASITQIASLAGVSRKTASKALKEYRESKENPS